MSTTTLFGVPANTLRPGPTLTIVQQADGKTTATMDFTCRKYDVSKALIQSKLVKGTPLLTLYPQAGTEFNYIFLDGWTSRDEPGGITTVTCEFSGVDPGEAGDSNESAITYSRNNALREEPIFKHPDFLVIPTAIREGIKAASEGTAYLSGTEIKRSTNDEVIADMVGDDVSLQWYELIVAREITTYLVPTSEWTKNATNRGKLKTADLANMGKQVTPPGDPTPPAGQTWLFTGATEEIQVLGDGANSYSLSYTSGVWPVEIYPNA